MTSFVTGSSFECVSLSCADNGAFYVRLIHDSRDPKYSMAMPVRFVEEEDNNWLNLVEDKRPLRWIIGEQVKFLNQTEKCLARVMRALILTHSKLLDTFTFGKQNNDSFVAIVEIPQGKEREFEKIASVILIRPPSVKIN